MASKESLMKQFNDKFPRNTRKALRRMGPVETEPVEEVVFEEVVVKPVKKAVKKSKK